MALPAMAALRRMFAEDEVAIAALPSVLAIFQEDHAVAPVSLLPIEGGTGRRTIQSLAAGRFDRIVLFTGSFGSAWVARRAGIRERWGFRGQGRRVLLTRPVRKPSKAERRHHADFYRTLARRFGAIDGVDDAPRLSVRAVTRARAIETLQRAGVDSGRPLVAFAPGAAYGHAKRWLPERVADVAARLVRSRRAAAVLVGAPDDRDTGRAIESWLRAHAPAESKAVANLIGKTDVRGLIGVLAQAKLVVANDSGAAHISAALDVPTITIFGPTDERGSAPIGPGLALSHDVFCRPCMLRDCPIDHRCMKRISADTVFDRAEALLQP
jgi:heptosyltransferase-2